MIYCLTENIYIIIRNGIAIGIRMIKKPDIYNGPWGYELKMSRKGTSASISDRDEHFILCISIGYVILKYQHSECELIGHDEVWKNEGSSNPCIFLEDVYAEILNAYPEWTIEKVKKELSEDIKMQICDALLKNKAQHLRDIAI
jgi:hypothetical protein